MVFCTKVDDCFKMKILLDKELLDYASSAEEICKRCNEGDYPVKEKADGGKGDERN